jgi:hypothetical protein
MENILAGEWSDIVRSVPLGETGIVHCNVVNKPQTEKLPFASHHIAARVE